LVGYQYFTKDGTVGETGGLKFIAFLNQYIISFVNSSLRGVNTLIRFTLFSVNSIGTSIGTLKYPYVYLVYLTVVTINK